jgi:spore coat protein H
VHFRVNGRYYGLMNNVQRVDQALLRDWGLDEDGNLYEADPPLEYSVPGGNLEPLENSDDYPFVYQWHNGPGAWQDLRVLIEDHLQTSDEEFAGLAEDVLVIDDILIYLATMAVLQNHEHIRKNYFLFRDHDGPDDRWLVLPWDTDVTLGHLWSEEFDVFDEQITSDSDLFVGEYAPERFGFYNQLIDRVLGVDVYRERFLELVAYLRQGAFSEGFLGGRIDHALCLIEPDVLADRSKRATNTEYLSRAEEIRQFILERSSYIDQFTP